MSRVSMASIACAAVASLWLSACEESELEPQTPVNAQLVEHEKMQNPDIRDGFPQVAEASYASAAATPPPPPRESVSLGIIGDEPLGRSDGYALPTHASPYWTRPFGTQPHGVLPYPPACRGCLRTYDAPLYPYYAPPPLPPTPY